MTRRDILLAACACLLPMRLALTSSLAAQTTPRTAPTLTVAGDVRTPLSLAPGDLEAMPRTRVEVKDEGGRPVTYEGVLVGEILKRAGAALGPEMRGTSVVSYVVASAADGYQVVFSLAELDPVFTGSEIIVADTID